MTAPFRIGGYYRQRNGDVRKVIGVIADYVTKDSRNFCDGGAVEVAGNGWRRASDGLAFNIYSERLPEFDLIARECDEHGNPLEDKKEPVKSIGAILREKLAASAPSELDGPSVFECTFFECDYDEPKRAPLPDYRDKPADRWDGYTVTKHTEPQASSHFLCASPDLQDESLSRHQLATVKG